MTPQVRLDVCLYIVKSQASTDAPWLLLCAWVEFGLYLAGNTNRVESLLNV